jgi:hypothetical protein
LRVAAECFGYSGAKRLVVHTESLYYQWENWHIHHSLIEFSDPDRSLGWSDLDQKLGMAIVLRAIESFLDMSICEPV